MKIEIKSKDCLFITLNNKVYYIDDSTDESIIDSWELKDYCQHCGSSLGIYNGDAEEDYNNSFCSKGCYCKYTYKN